MSHYKESSRHNSALVANLGGLFLVTALTNPTRRPATTNQPTNRATSHEPPFTLRIGPPRASLRIAALDLRIRANTILAVPYTPDIRSLPIYTASARERLAAFFPRECVKRSREGNTRAKRRIDGRTERQRDRDRKKMREKKRRREIERAAKMGKN